MLIQPILYNVPAFDASHSQEFKFFVNGGDQVVKNKLTIKTNDSEQTTIYESEVTTFQLLHTLPADTLTNGVYYQATIITYNSNGDSSAPSLPIQFHCYTQPTFNFIELPENNIINSSSYQFKVHYDQNESEPLSQYNFTLYDLSNNVVSTSGVVYTGSTTVPLDIIYVFDGFTNGESYKLLVTGKTFENTIIQTQLITISVSYEIPQDFAPIYVTNNCDGGYISVRSNLILVDGSYSGTTPTYIDNSEISLINNGESVTWDSNYLIPTNYSVTVWGKNFTNDEAVVILKNEDNDTVEVKYMFDDGVCWFELFVYHDGDLSNHVVYECMSNELYNVTSSTNVIVTFRHIDGLYGIWCSLNE